MSDTPMPASGDGKQKGEADGVSASPREDNGSGVHGRTAGGESGGGGYPGPQGGDADNSGFMGHGGQSEIGYHGGGQAGDEGGDAPNAATGSDSSDGEERGSAPAPAPERAARDVQAGGRTFQVIESNGVAEAETMGKIGTDASYEREQEAPGAG